MPSHQVHVGLLLGLILGLLIIGVHGHGSLTQPRPRNLITYITQARNDLLGRVEISGTWIKDHGNGHGRAVVKPTWGPGVCGDPYQHHDDPGTFYLNRAGTPVISYSAGATISVSWWLQVNHGGRIGFKLCPRRDNLNQACFDQYPLFRADVANERFTYILNGRFGEGLQMSASYRLPSGVSCAGGCVLQWEYLTMNSCYEPCNRAVCGAYADRINPMYPGGLPNMGTCCFGTAANGCDPSRIPEVFRNCADIIITGTGTSTPVPRPGTNPCDKCNLPVTSGGCKCDSNCNCLVGTPTPVPPPSTNPCDKCNLPVTSGGCKCDSNCNCLPTSTTCTRVAASGGSCGGGTCCPSGQCCSQWGWCGTTTSHCGTGCQRSFGTCAAGVASLTATDTSPARAGRRRRGGSKPVEITSTMEPSRFAPFDPDVTDPATAALAERPSFDPTLPVPANGTLPEPYIPSVVTESAAVVDPAAAVINPAAAVVDPAAAVVDPAAAVVDPAAAVVDPAAAVVDPATAVADPAAAVVDPADPAGRR